MPKLLRLDKILADSGQFSRKEAREVIRQGRVSVDGSVVRQADRKVDPENSIVRADGVRLGWSESLYLMLNKPAGYLTATEDAREPTVMDLIPREYRRKNLAPVGRLDKDTTGLLLLTDDGELAHALLSPRHHVDKVYLAQVDGTAAEEDCAAFAGGLTLGDGTVCLPARLEPLGQGLCRVTVQEGKYHQVKRMLASRGLPVRNLKRVSMGPLQIDETLEAGACRLLTQEELRLLRAAAGVDLSDSSKYTK